MASRSPSDVGGSLLLLLAAVASYVFYLAHSFAVSRFCLELWRLSRKFVLRD